MAKIRLRFGQNEVEIESRDFYIDNNTLSEVISELAARLGENSPKLAVNYGQTTPRYHAQDYLEMLNEAEVHEPEFSAPVPVSSAELPSKIEALQKESFFSVPRTVSETVERLREHGWLVSPLDVSKILAKMAFHRELAKNSQENRILYSENVSS